MKHFDLIWCARISDETNFFTKHPIYFPTRYKISIYKKVEIAFEGEIKLWLLIQSINGKWNWKSLAFADDDGKLPNKIEN